MADGQCLCCAASLLFIQIVLTGWVETKRLMDFQNPGTQDNWLGEGGQFKPMDNGYPGGAFFDPFGLSRGSESQLRKYQVGRHRMQCRPLHVPACSAASHMQAIVHEEVHTLHMQGSGVAYRNREGAALEELQLSCMPAACCTLQCLIQRERQSVCIVTPLPYYSGQ